MGKQISLEREKAIGQWDLDVEIIVRLGSKRYPLTVDAAKQLQDKLNNALRPKS